MPTVKLPLDASAAARVGKPTSGRALRRDFMRDATGQHVSIKKMARLTGLNVNTIKYIRDGVTTKPSFRACALILRVLGKSNSWLLGYLEAIKPTSGNARNFGMKRREGRDALIWKETL